MKLFVVLLLLLAQPPPPIKPGPGDPGHPIPVERLPPVNVPAPPRHYIPEAIDSLWESHHEFVQVAGTVHTVALDGDQLVVVIGDGHGHMLPCDLPDLGFQQPLVGSGIIVYGLRKVFPIVGKGQGAIAISPVDRIELQAR